MNAVKNHVTRWDECTTGWAMNSKMATTKKTAGARPPAMKRKGGDRKSRKVPLNVVGEAVRKKRLALKLSLRALAEQAKLSYEAVRLVEAGRGGIRALSSMLVALKFSKAQRSEFITSYLEAAA